MKRNILLLLLVLIAITSYSQKRKPIVYIVPDKVEIMLDSCIQFYSKRDFDFYFILEKDSLYNITVASYQKNEAKRLIKWVKQSNRRIVINNKTYPLIFDYDFKFGVKDDNIGVFKNRDSNIRRSRVISHGITIMFDSWGDYVKMI
jgi:hypothetical protein